jgi:hypothetical protein
MMQDLDSSRNTMDAYKLLLHRVNKFILIWKITL